MAQLQSSSCDLLIIGAGPAGFMAATWAARCGINTRIIDKRGTKIFKGHADGLQCRTLEIFDSFGFADRALKESSHMLEICFWNPDASGKIQRTGRLPDTLPGISRFQEVVLHQGRIERFFLDSLKKYSSIEVERAVLPEALELDSSKLEDDDAYPITLRVKHLKDEEITENQNGLGISDDKSSLAKDDLDELISQNREKSGSVETIRAKYAIGCDGAHSWTRQQLGFTMEGEQTDFVWGVMEIIPITDFPDIRVRCVIHSAASGSVMVIPRENRIVRLYIQLNEIGKAGTQFNRTKITPDIIFKAAQKIMSPYQLAYKHCEWWTAYQIGQRMSNQFSASDRVFLAGDAVHTHSPKAGQGMNVSIQDTYNLGWKIAAVINGIAKRSILKTYQLERRRVAQDLITFDQKFARLCSGRPAKDAADEAGISVDEVKQVFQKAAMLTSGLAVNYDASILTAKPKDPTGDSNGIDSDSLTNGMCKVVGKPELASNIKVGMRLPSAQVLNQSDSRPWQLGHLLKSDGRFRIVVFAGNLKDKDQWQRIQNFGEDLAHPDSFLHRFTSSSKSIDSVIEILMVHSAPRTEIELLDLHEIFHPFDSVKGWDYEKVFVDDTSYHQGHGEAYQYYGIEQGKGCVVVTRPDQHVAFIGEVEDISDMDSYFSGFLIARA